MPPDGGGSGTRTCRPGTSAASCGSPAASRRSALHRTGRYAAQHLPAPRGKRDGGYAAQVAGRCHHVDRPPTSDPQQRHHRVGPRSTVAEPGPGRAGPSAVPGDWPRPRAQTSRRCALLGQEPGRCLNDAGMPTRATSAPATGTVGHRYRHRSGINTTTTTGTAGRAGRASPVPDRSQSGWSVLAGSLAVSDPACARALGSRRTLIRLATVVTVNTTTMTARLRLVLISGTLSLRPCP